MNLLARVCRACHICTYMIAAALETEAEAQSRASLTIQMSVHMQGHSDARTILPDRVDRA